MRPTKPRYTWDVSIVLRYLEGLHPLETLSFRQLTEKTVTLLALGTAHRAQTLASILITNIHTTCTGLHITVDERIKTSGPGRFQPLLILPRFQENPSLCVATVLRRYLEVTETLRGKEPHLFIATKKPFRRVGSQTLGRWIKQTLDRSGIDVSIFKAHSVRHASTSAAFRRGVDLNTIRKTAGWSSTSQTFAKLYNRPLVPDQNTFAQAILGNQR